MPFTLRVEFRGVCAFVPNEPFFKKIESGTAAGNPSRVDVLLPNMMEPRVAPWETSAAQPDLNIRASHWPALIFDLNDVDEGASDLAVDTFFTNWRDLPVDTAFSSWRDLPLRAMRVLAREVVTLLGDSQPLSFANAIPNSEEDERPKSDEQKKSLWWLPQLAEISPEHALADSSLLTGRPPKPKDGDPDVAARVEIRGGHLSVAAFSQYSDPTIEDPAWDFHSLARSSDGEIKPTSSAPVWKRVIGNRLTLEQTISAESVTIEVRGSATHRVVLRPAKSDLVRVSIVNDEPEGILRGVEVPSVPRQARADLDFLPLYSLSTLGSTGTLRVPFKKVGAASSKEKPCAPAAFAGGGVKS